MPRKTLYILSLIATLFFALSLLFVPNLFWSFYGTTTDANGIWIGRFMTALMLGNVYVLWKMKDYPASSKEAKIVSQREILDWVLIGVYIVIFTLQGGYNYMGRMTAGLCFIFAILFTLDAYKT